VVPLGQVRFPEQLVQLGQQFVENSQTSDLVHNNTLT